MIVVLHRERSEKLALKFNEMLAEQGRCGCHHKPCEFMVRAFDALIQEGLISER